MRYDIVDIVCDLIDMRTSPAGAVGAAAPAAVASRAAAAAERVAAGAARGGAAAGAVRGGAAAARTCTRPCRSSRSRARGTRRTWAAVAPCSRAGGACKDADAVLASLPWGAGLRCAAAACAAGRARRRRLASASSRAPPSIS